MSETEAQEKSKNTVTIEDAGPCRKKVKIQVPEESVNKALDEQYGELHRDAIIPGFRKGRAPRRLLEKRFGKEVGEQVKVKLIAEASESAIKENELDSLTEPEVDPDNVELPESGPLTFEFEVEVRPEFELPSLEEVAVEKPKLQVTDEQIDEQIEQYRRQLGTWVPVESGGVQSGDRVIADAVLKAEGIEEPETLENTPITVSSPGSVGRVAVENLEDVLKGAEPGETKKTTVKLPKTYYDETYRGREVEVEITVQDIKRLKPAELNEAFFKRAGVADEDELSERVGEMLQSRLEQQARNAMSDQVYKYLLENTDFELPADVVADQSQRMLKQQYSNMLLRGVSRDEIQQQIGQLQSASEERAREQVKLFFIMDKVAKQLDVEVSDEEVNGHIARVAIQQGRRPEKMREEMTRDGSLANFVLQVREQKCVEKILESAKITEVEPDEKTGKTKKKQTKKTNKKSGGSKSTKAEKSKPTRRKKTSKKKEQDK